MTDIRNVFLPHRHEDDHLVSAFKELLKDRGVQIRDSSITSDKPNKAHNPDYIMREILKPGIDWAGKVVVIVTPDTKNHEWVNQEIEYAHKKNYPIIGVWGPDFTGCELPEALEKYGDDMLPWKADKILKALNGARVFQEPDGSTRKPQPMIRNPCN